MQRSRFVRRVSFGMLLLCCPVAIVPMPARAEYEYTLIPIPEIITDPNEGTTSGLLPVILVASEDKAIRSIIAPDVRYNDITGITPTLRFFDYPTPRQHYSLIGGKGTERGEHVSADYSGEGLFNGWIDLSGAALHEQDPFERFYGIGNDTPSSNETNYQSTTEATTVSSALNLPDSLQTSIQARVRHVRIGQGGVTSLPQLRNPSSGFSNINGVGGITIVGTRFGLAYDTRDMTLIPTEGVLASTTVEIVDKALGSSTSFMKYGVEGKAFVPVRKDKRIIVALHGVLNYIQNADHAPFYELSSIGGFHSLRGFGSNRFTDNHRFFAQSELRSNVYEREVFGVHAHLEIAPFVDLGRVFNSSRVFPLEHVHPVGGLGVRAVVVPQVVAYVDFGSAGGSPSVFTGIDYPF